MLEKFTHKYIYKNKRKISYPSYKKNENFDIKF